MKPSMIVSCPLFGHMFRTPVTVKEDTKIKGKELKKLRADFSEAFALPDEALNRLLPNKVAFESRNGLDWQVHGAV